MGGGAGEEVGVAAYVAYDVPPPLIANSAEWFAAVSASTYNHSISLSKLNQLAHLRCRNVQVLLHGLQFILL